MVKKIGVIILALAACAVASQLIQDAIWYAVCICMIFTSLVLGFQWRREQRWREQERERKET